MLSDIMLKVAMLIVVMLSAKCRGASHASHFVMVVNYDRKLFTVLATNKQQRL
jgi:hypothetical protein